ncbi:MAG: PotD/PotF family extracellular solute-binding protein [Wujia sp.]
MKKKKLISMLMVSAMCAAMLAGCGAEKEDGAAATGEEINVYAWVEEIPDELIEGFEKETGIKVNLSTFSSNEEAIAKIEASPEGTYDIVGPSDYAVEELIEAGYLQSYDVSSLSNYGNLKDIYKNPDYDPEAQYAVPLVGGMIIGCVNTDYYDGEITSMEDFLDPAFANNLVVVDDFRGIIGMVSKSMGYGLNETDEDKLAEVQEELMKYKSQVKILDSDSPKMALINGEVIGGICWSEEVAIAMAEDEAIKPVFFDDGGQIFTDALCIVKGTQHEEACKKFMDYVLKPESTKILMEEYPYLNPNKAAEEILPADFLENLASNPSDEIIARQERTRNIGTTVDVYTDMWNEFTK